MARKLRVEFAGACYHVTNRGNYRRDLFATDGAAESFQVCLGETCESFGWRIHAYEIMRNHFHLAVETPEPNLSEGMKWLQGTWAMRFNRFHGEFGRPFQGRYKAKPIEPGYVLAQVAHYIHLNPFAAGIVTPQRLADYPWSSLHHFVRKGRPRWLAAATLLRESGGLSDTPAGWRAYCKYLGVLAEEDTAVREAKFRQLIRGWAPGSTTFRAELRAELSERDSAAAPFQLLGADRLSVLQARAEAGNSASGSCHGHFARRLPVCQPEKSAMEKLQLAAAMKMTTSVSNGWLAQRLQTGSVGSLGSLLTRFRSGGGTARRDFKSVLSQFLT